MLRDLTYDTFIKMRFRKMGILVAERNISEDVK
jgi:hypothetical protein